MRPLSVCLLPLVLTLAASSGGCTSREPDPRRAATIPRETFVEAYVELRVAALRTPTQELSPEARQRVLDGFGITDQDLLTYAEVWGDDLDYMKGVWVEVDSILRSRRDQPEGPGRRGSQS